MEQEEFKNLKMKKKELHKKLQEEGKVSHNGWTFQFRNSRSFIEIISPDGEIWKVIHKYELDRAIAECVGEAMTKQF